MNKLNIKSKSILKRVSKKDGLRICVMRRIKPEYKFDLWIPNLAPSEKLLNKYVVLKSISWLEFSVKYKKRVLSKNKALLRLINLIAKTKKITLLCYETKDTYCHRSLIIKECNRLKA